MHLNQTWFRVQSIITSLITLSPGLWICWLYPLQMNKTPPHTHTPKMFVLGRIPNCIWWRGSRSVDLENVEYPFITNTSRPTLIWSGNSYLDLIYRWNRSVLKIIRQKPKQRTASRRIGNTHTMRTDITFYLEEFCFSVLSKK